MFVGDRGLVQWHSGGAVVAQSGNGGMDDFTDGVVRPATFITIRDNSLGGHDTIRGLGGEDILIGGTGNDRIDGGLGRDLIFGDNVELDRRTTLGNHTNPRFRVLDGTQIYSTAGRDAAGAAQVTGAWQNDPAGATAWSDFRIRLLDHADDTPADRYGNDYNAGGAADDVIFGQLGSDVIQGDGSIDLAVGAERTAAGDLIVNPSAEAATDSDDYIEGGGGSDVTFGNLGRDDIIGGSSGLFSLETADARSDASDLIFGGAARGSAVTTTMPAMARTGSRSTARPATGATPTPSSATTATSTGSSRS